MEQGDVFNSGGNYHLATSDFTPSASTGLRLYFTQELTVTLQKKFLSTQLGHTDVHPK